MVSENQNVDPEFVARMQKSLDDWIETFKKLDEFDWFEIDKDRAYLFQLLSFGIAHPATFKTAVSLTILLFEYIERRGYWQEWYAIYELAYAQFDPSNQSHLKYQLLNCLIQLNILMDKLEETDYYLNLIAKDLDLNQSTAQIGSLKCSSAQMAIRKNEYERAIEDGEFALKIYKKINDRSGIAHALVILGMAYHHMGNSEQAIKYYKTSLRHWQRLENNFWAARTMINLAYCQIEANEFAGADAYFEQALQILASSNYEFDKSTAHINRGLLYFRMEEWEQAENEFVLANSRFLRESPHTYLKSLVFHNLGSVQIKKGDYSLAEENLNFAVELRRGIDDDLRLASSLGTTGELLKLNGKAGESKVVLDEALELLQNYPDNEWALDMKFKFSELLESVE